MKTKEKLALNFDKVDRLLRGRDGVGMEELLFVVFLHTKLTGNFPLGWFWVFSPFVFKFAVFMFFFYREVWIRNKMAREMREAGHGVANEIIDGHDS